MEDIYSLTDLEERFQTNQEAIGRAKGTTDRYGFTFQILDRFLAEREIKPTSKCLTTEDMDQFAIWLRETPIKAQHGINKRAEAGVHAHLRDLRAFCRWLQKQELLTKPVEFPMPRLPKTLFKILTDQELVRVWNCKYLTGKSPRSIRNRALIALMLDTGLRREEVASVGLKDIEVDHCMVTVFGKGSKERRVFFSPDVQSKLREFLLIRGEDDEPLFHLNADGIRTTFRRIQLETGLERFHPHQLRHQYGTMMVRNKADLETVRRLMGHEDYNTTLRYMSLSDDDLKTAQASASPFSSLMRQVGEPEAMPKRKKYSSKEIA